MIELVATPEVIEADAESVESQAVELSSEQLESVAGGPVMANW